jgi:hypothetical protein
MVDRLNTRDMMERRRLFYQSRGVHLKAVYLFIKEKYR